MSMKRNPGTPLFSQKPLQAQKKSSYYNKRACSTSSLERNKLLQPLKFQI
jgi:hypothetical protein